MHTFDCYFDNYGQLYVSKPGKKDNFIYFTKHCIANYKLPQTVENTMKKCSKFYLELSPYEPIFKIEYSAFLQLNKLYEILRKLKKNNHKDIPHSYWWDEHLDDKNFREFFMKVFSESKNNINQLFENQNIKNSKRNILDLNINYFAKYIVEKLFYNYNSKITFKSIEHEIFKKIPTKYLNNIYSLDKAYDFKLELENAAFNSNKPEIKNLTINEALTKYPGIINDELGEYRGREIIGEIYDEYLRFTNIPKTETIPGSSLGLDILYYQGFYDYQSLGKQRDTNYLFGKRTEDRNIHWIKNHILKNDNTFFAAGAGHFISTDKNNLKYLLEKEGYKITNVYEEETFKKITNKLNDFKDLKTCTKFINKNFLELAHYNYLRIRITKLYLKKLEEIKNSNNEKLIKKQSVDLCKTALNDLEDTFKKNPFFITKEEYDELKFFFMTKVNNL